jgi:4-carboxymuconolactone decarboxylase
MTEQRFAPLSDADMTEEQKRSVRALWSTPRDPSIGLGPFNGLLRSPELLDRVQHVGDYLRFHSSLPKRLTELAILLTARKWTAQFEWWAHHPIALNAGLDPAIAAAIAVGERPASMDREEAAIHAFASELLARGEVSDAHYAEAHALFGERGVVDLVGTVGYYSLLAMVLNVDRYPIPRGEPAPLR